MRALLDVNVLIALLDSAHQHHDTAMAWFARYGQNGWATCPITQNGCIRIMSQPSYPAGQLQTVDVAQRLASAAAHPSHLFWPDDVNLLQHPTLNWHNISGHRQMTDVYLLALAVQHQGALVTFDRRILLDAVSNAKAENLISILE